MSFITVTGHHFDMIEGWLKHALQIEHIVSIKDGISTYITMDNGDIFTVKESFQEVMEQIREQEVMEQIREQEADL